MWSLGGLHLAPPVRLHGCRSRRPARFLRAGLADGRHRRVRGDRSRQRRREEGMEAQVISKVSRRSLEVEAVEGLAGRQPGFGEVAFEPWAFSPPRVWLTARLSCAFSPQRDRWFANSPLEGSGFELPVPRLGNWRNSRRAGTFQRHGGRLVRAIRRSRQLTYVPAAARSRQSQPRAGGRIRSSSGPHSPGR